MHASSLENMRHCYEQFVAPAGFTARPAVDVLDIGGADVNGSYRSVFPSPPFHYRVADLAEGSGVDLVLADPTQIPLPDASIDILVSGQMLEHCPRFWLTFNDMVRVLKPDGLLILIAPSAGPIHRYPVDCYRFYPDAYTALAEEAGCYLHAVWLDERGPWRDLVGVFSKRETLELSAADSDATPTLPVPPPACPGTEEEERTAGRRPYLELLAQIHADLAPRRYLEIGVRHGHSLVLAGGPAIGIDPAPELEVELPPSTELIRLTSDRFFEAPLPLAPRQFPTLAPTLSEAPPELALIDGMHLFEYALRDFMHLERVMRATGLILIDDIAPSHPRQAQRTRATKVWTGDVWKLHRCLADERPDLLLVPLDTAPTGMLLVACLDPGNRVLWDRYNPCVRRYRDQRSETPPPEVLGRAGALDPHSPLLTELLTALRRLRADNAGVAEVAHALSPLRAHIARLGADKDASADTGTHPAAAGHPEP